MKTIFCLLIILLPLLVNGQYTGTGSVTQGGGMTTDSNLYSCSGGRITNVGTITASDNSVWTVPADVNFMNASFPFAFDLYNSCNGATHATSADAIAALNGSDIITIDSSGELITAFIFADNYFEMFINGVPVGKDNVPYTQFNSNIIRFKVNRPFTVAMLLVDWEEHLGVGCENNNGFEYHMGDGGMVAVFEDANNNIIETTRSNWKAQTFYTSPIIDLGCPTENGLLRLSNNCGTQDSNNGTSYYGLHWSIPSNWMNSSFDDSSWPSATTYTNDVVGVNNKPAYTNFTNIFDAPSNDAQFIWSTNLILDNEVIVRCTVGISNSIFQDKINLQLAYPFPNPFNEKINLLNKGGKEFYELYNEIGENIFSGIQIEQQDFSNLVDGVYFLKVITPNTMQTFKLIK
ncbi:MAG: T9SS type A sorting domain-containing protein [Bacteroidota bacterium]